MTRRPVDGRPLCGSQSASVLFWRLRSASQNSYDNERRNRRNHSSHRHSGLFARPNADAHLDCWIFGQANDREIPGLRNVARGRSARFTVALRGDGRKGVA